MVINFGVFGVAVAVCFVIILVLQVAKYGCGKIFFSEPKDVDFKNDIYKVVNKTSLTIVVIAVIMSVIGFALAPVAVNKPHTDLGYGQVIEKIVTTEVAAMKGVEKVTIKKQEALSEIKKVDEQSAAEYDEFMKKFKKGEK